MDESINPTYQQGLVASNRLTDARSELWDLVDLLPISKQMDAVQLYNRLCHVQGALENLLSDIPIHKGEDNGR